MEVRENVQVGADTYGIRKLSWKSLDEARKAQQIGRAERVRALGGDVLKVLRSEALETAAKALADQQKGQDAEDKRKAEAEARYDSYDLERILVAGVETRNGTPLKPSQVVNEIDKATAEALHRAIVDLSDPAPEETENAEGKH